MRLQKIFFNFILILLIGLILQINNIYLKSFIALALSILFVYKARKNVYLIIISSFILYSNYSIILTEYLGIGNAAQLYEAKNQNIYSILINQLIIFIAIISIFIESNNRDITIRYKKNNYLYTLFVLIIIFIGLFGINRDTLYTYNQARITPYYEYLTIIILFAIRYSGKIKYKINIIIILSLMLMIQDFLYGGRITSLQICFILMVTIFKEKINFKNLFKIFFIGIFLLSFIGAYREQYKFTNLLIVINQLIKGGFAFDTPIYAYYSSATHVAASEILDNSIKINSLKEFLFNILFGNSDNLGNITSYISKNLIYNVGGGLIFSYFYFWLNYVGTIIIGIIVVIILNNITKFQSDLLDVMYIYLCISVPRWYLYTPLNIFRGTFIIIPIIFGVSKLIDNLT